MKTNINHSDINERMIREASDTLLFLSDSFTENQYKMRDMEFMCHVEEACQDIIYNLTSTVRNLTSDLDDDDETPPTPTPPPVIPDIYA